MALNAQLGIVAEGSFGGGGTPSRFYEFLSETMKFDKERIASAGIRAGTRVARDDRWVAGRRKADGAIVMEIMNKSFGLWFKHMFGTVALSQPSAGPDPTVWDQTFTPGSLVGLSLFAQIGRDPRGGGVALPFGYPGFKVPSWEIGCGIGEIPKLTVNGLARDEDTATALAAASYPSALTPFTFVDGSVTIGGTATPIRQLTVTGDNKLDSEDFAFGSGLRREAQETDLRDYGGTFDADFTDMTAYNRYVNGTIASIVATYAAATISNSFKYSMVITMNARFDGDTPNVSNVAEIRLPLSFKALAPAAGGNAISLLYRSTDVAS